MLDFYLISDDDAKPNSKDIQKLKCIGQVDQDVFEYLKTINIIETRFDPYSTFRWNTVFVKQKIELIENSQYRKDTKVLKMLDILKAANRQPCGLIAIGD